MKILIGAPGRPGKNGKPGAPGVPGTPGRAAAICGIYLNNQINSINF